MDVWELEGVRRPPRATRGRSSAASDVYKGEDLKRNQAALAEACGKFAPGASIVDCFAKMAANKPEKGPVQEARDQLPPLRAFLIEMDLVTIPGTEVAQVEESPPYNRANRPDTLALITIHTLRLPTPSKHS